MKDTIVTINGKDADLSKSLPLTIGAMKKLKREFGIDMANMRDGNLDIEEMANVLFYVASKANPEISIEDIDDISTNALADIMSVFNRVQSSETDKDFLK